MWPKGKSGSISLSVKALALLVLFGAGFAHAQIPHPNPFQHIVLIIQENRTPDNLFHALLTWPGINPAKYNLSSNGVNSSGQIIALTPEPLGNPYDLSHAHHAFQQMYDGGKMDGADLITCTGTCPANPQFKYVDNSTHLIDPYLNLAAQYGWANFMFQTNQGPSTPAHLFLLAGTSAPTKSDDGLGVFLAETPSAPTGVPATGETGCLAPATEWNWLVNPTGPETKLLNDPLGALCFSHDTMATLLDDAGLTWKYYAAAGTKTVPGGYLLNAPNHIREICVPDAGYTTCTGTEWANNVDLVPADVLTDIRNCKLANVSWVTPIYGNSDHPGNASGGPTGGPSWVASIVNSIGSDTTCEGGKGYWSDTAVIVVWDDWGGWYDHEPPTILKGVQGDYQYGFRVPMIVVSAYTPKASVNNSRHDFGSILRFIEGVFDIPEGALKFADARANNDLSAFFNFKAKPRVYQTIPAPLDADFFINDTTPPEPPDDD